jgi:hypothetical protein
MKTVLAVAVLMLYASTLPAQTNSTTTVTGPNGQTATRSATRGNGQTNVTFTGPDGKTATRNTNHYAGGNSTTITGPNGYVGNRTVTGRGTGAATITRSGPRGTFIRRR